MEKRIKERDSCPPAHLHSQAEHAVHGKEYFHWPAGAACLPGLAPSQLLNTCSLAECEKLEKKSFITSY